MKTIFSSEWGALRTSAVILLCSLTLPLTALAQNYALPSQRFRLILAPVMPTSYEQCAAMAAEFQSEIRKLSKAHEDCLQNAPAGQARDTHGTCSHPACQGLHTARDQATQAAQEKGQACRSAVASYLVSKREDERREREAAQRRADNEWRLREIDQRAAQRQADNERQRDERDQQRQTERDRRDAERARRQQLVENAEAAERATLGARRQEEDDETPSVSDAAVALWKAAEQVPRERPFTTGARQKYEREHPGQPNPYGTPQPLVPEKYRLSDEQKRTLVDTGFDALWTRWAQLAVVSVETAMKRAVGTVKGHGVMGVAGQTLDAQTAADIQLVIQTQKLTPYYLTNSPAQARQLQRLEDEERAEREVQRRNQRRSRP